MVIGIGNGWRRDDAAGLEVARRLRTLAPAGVSIDEREGEPAGLLDAWEGAESAVIVDAVSSGASPGTLHRFDAVTGPLPTATFGHSTHALGLADAVELGRALGRLPRRLIVYGIEGQRFDAGAGLSPAVDRAVDRLCEKLRAELEASAAAPPRA
jgi:hydrogenase maturation protease